MLRLYPLDGRMMDSKDALHSHLYMQFSLPAYYGRNLDALWDCLTEKEPGCILIQRADAAEKSLLLPLLGLFLDLVRETPGWSVRLSTGSPDCHENDDAPHSGSACKGDCAACQTSCAQSQVPAVPVGTPEERRPLSFVVFDFDGVLADSEPLHRMTHRELEHELFGDRKVAIASSRLRGGSTRLVYKMVLDAMWRNSMRSISAARLQRCLNSFRHPRTICCACSTDSMRAVSATACVPPRRKAILIPSCRLTGFFHASVLL